ncbi:MAG: DNA recombination protein RmuC [Leptospirales bacterium]|nr:DNA recombination protein RmuC [Leptospirales bacterium]
MTDFLLAFNALAISATLGLMLILFLRRQGSADPGLDRRLDSQEKQIEKLERGLREEIARNRTEATTSARQGREELQNSLHKMTESNAARLTDMSRLQQQSLDTMRKTVEDRLRLLQEDNVKKLEEMRSTVDEKLQSTLERRLSDSFRLVSERLEQVHKGLGEMQHLAVGVGDLKKVLANVKTRGNWGEIQLSLLLEQILSPDQYDKNVRTRTSGSDYVEFAIKIPINDQIMWLPVDSKFPQDVYDRLVVAQENADPDLVEKAGRDLESFIKKSAREIADKYVEPPRTTDYAILFLPTEGLYAEVIRRTGLVTTLQADFRVAVAGPTTLAALLNTFQMGFRTMAIQKRSNEVWELLEEIQHDFGKFGVLLEKTQKKLQDATDSIHTVRGKADRMQKRLAQAGTYHVTDGAGIVNGEQEAQELLGLK